MEESPSVLFPLLQEGWSRAREKVLGWLAEKLVQIKGAKLWYGDSNLNPGKRNECALSGWSLPTLSGGETEPYTNSHWCQCKTKNILFKKYYYWFYFKFLDGPSYYIDTKLPQICSIKFSCLSATSHLAPSIFSKRVLKVGEISGQSLRKKKYWAWGP